MPAAVRFLLGAALLTLVATASAQQRFPPPEFDSGHELPSMTRPAPAMTAGEIVDMLILVAALSLSAYLALWRRSRAAAENIIPSSTGAAKAVGEVLPQLQGKLHGIAARVPVPDGSVVDLFVKLGKSVTVDDVNDAVRAASESERLRGILQYSETPIVSSDIIGNSHSSIYDAGFSGVTADRYLRVLNWYDNEWGYSCRVCDLLARIDAW